jgi:hypothetical protein
MRQINNFLRNAGHALLNLNNANLDRGESDEHGRQNFVV